MSNIQKVTSYLDRTHPRMSEIVRELVKENTDLKQQLGEHKTRLKAFEAAPTGAAKNTIEEDLENFKRASSVPRSGCSLLREKLFRDAFKPSKYAQLWGRANREPEKVQIINLEEDDIPSGLKATDIINKALAHLGVNKFEEPDCPHSCLGASSKDDCEFCDDEDVIMEAKPARFKPQKDCIICYGCFMVSDGDAEFCEYCGNKFDELGEE